MNINFKYGLTSVFNNENDNNDNNNNNNGRHAQRM